MPEDAGWVVDTSVFTHLSRAGHADLLERLSPREVILVPAEVNDEIRVAREIHHGIPDPCTLPWAQLTVLTDDEVWTQISVKAALGGTPRQHLGESAVIACANHRGLTALLDDRAACAQADVREVPHRDTLWLVIEAWARFADFNRAQAEQAVDDLLSTGMWLPTPTGASLFAWAYEEGLLPRVDGR